VAGRIEDYAIVGDMQSAALVSAAGSIDRLCLPRFDPEACFTAPPGSQDHGCRRIALELSGRHEEAIEPFEQLFALRNRCWPTR
jgi:GH15 family glucan-1,4-alpha-glucosidase